jgi:CII-binding regulator of phage lambda lysogenization HflD
MSDRDFISQLSQQLSAIQEQLNQFANRFDNIQQQLEELSPLSQQIAILDS